MIISRWNLFKGFLISIFIISGSPAEEPIRIAAIAIPEYVISGEEGIFIDLIKDLLTEYKEPYRVEVFPPKRAFRYFQSGVTKGFFPSLGTLSSEQAYLSEPFYYKKDYFFSHSPILEAPKKGRVCVTNGYHYDYGKFPKGLEVIKSLSDESCLKMLQKKRVDFFLCELITGILAIEESKVKNIHVFKEAFSSLPVYFAFSKDKMGAHLHKVLNAKLVKLREEKKLYPYFRGLSKRVEKKLGIIFDPTTP